MYKCIRNTPCVCFQVNMILTAPQSHLSKHTCVSLIRFSYMCMIFILLVKRKVFH